MCRAMFWVSFLAVQLDKFVFPYTCKTFHPSQITSSQSHAAPCLDSGLERRIYLCSRVFPILIYQNSFDSEIRELESSLKWRFLHRFLTRINLSFNLKSLKWSVPLYFCQMKNEVWLPAAWKWNHWFNGTGLLVLCCAELIWHIIL